MDKCPKCRRPKAEGSKFCRACYAVFGAPGGFSAISRHNRDAKIASVLMQLFIISLATMAVWLIQTDFQFIKAARGSVEQSVAQAKRETGWFMEAGGGSTDQLSAKDAVKISGANQQSVAVDIDRSGNRSIKLATMKIRAPPKPVDYSDTVTQQQATATLISAVSPCPAGHVCRGIVRFDFGGVGEYAVIGSSTSSTMIVASDRHASRLLRKFDRGTLEVGLDDGRIRTLPIFKGHSGKWAAE